MDATPTTLGELIAAVGLGVADAQLTIDTTVIDHFSAVYDESIESFAPLRDIGYQPTWYQVAEASAEIVLALTVTREQRGASSPTHVVRGAHVDARYRSTFTHGVKARSSLTFRIVPVPPPAAGT